MLLRCARLNPAKSGNAKACAPGRQPITIVPDVALERESGSGKQTSRDPRLLLRGKAARRRAVETGCNEHLSNLRRTRRYSMQAIVAHGFSPLISASGTLIGRNGGQYLDRRQKISIGFALVMKPMRKAVASSQSLVLAQGGEPGSRRNADK